MPAEVKCAMDEARPAFLDQWFCQKTAMILVGNLISMLFIIIMMTMNFKLLVCAILLALLLNVPVILHYSLPVKPLVTEDPAGLFVGVDVAYDNIDEIKLLADKIQGYTNAFIIGSTGITFDMAKLDEVVQYVYDRGFYFMIYTHPQFDVEKIAIQRQWVVDAKNRWGEYFLGLYAYDEPGGRQLDNATLKLVLDADWYADTYGEAADKYVNTLFVYLHHMIEDQLGALDLPLFTSDYALYWFDYQASYDTVFAEFGWNYSRALNVALNRGAANVQNKDWGVMITWTYTQPPYLESGSELYNDLVLAYENGAKYIFVFDTNEEYTHGVLQDGHYEALRRFWQYAIDNPRQSDPIVDRVAYVLPKGYGYGFRGPNDKIWGLWEADTFSLSNKISVELGGLISEYQNRLDIIYDDGLEVHNSYGYSKLIFWNGTIWIP